MCSVTNRQLPAGQTLCSAAMMPLANNTCISGCTVNAPVSIEESTAVTNENINIIYLRKTWRTLYILFGFILKSVAVCFVLISVFTCDCAVVPVVSR